MRRALLAGLVALVLASGTAGAAPGGLVGMKSFAS